MALTKTTTVCKTCLCDLQTIVVFVNAICHTQARRENIGKRKPGGRESFWNLSSKLRCHDEVELRLFGALFFKQIEGVGWNLYCEWLKEPTELGYKVVPGLRELLPRGKAGFTQPGDHLLKPTISQTLRFRVRRHTGSWRWWRKWVLFLWVENAFEFGFAMVEKFEGDFAVLPFLLSFPIEK